MDEDNEEENQADVDTDTEQVTYTANTAQCISILYEHLSTV